jgi:hypothetical protein
MSSRKLLIELSSEGEHFVAVRASPGHVCREFACGVWRINPIKTQFGHDQDLPVEIFFVALMSNHLDDWLIACPVLVSISPSSVQIACAEHDWRRIALEWSRTKDELELVGVWPFDAIVELSRVLRLPDCKIRKLTIGFVAGPFFAKMFRPRYHLPVSRADVLGLALEDSNLEVVHLSFAEAPYSEIEAQFANAALRCPTLAVLRLSYHDRNLASKLRYRARSGLKPLHRLEMEASGLSRDFLRHWSEYGVDELLIRGREPPPYAPRRFAMTSVRGVFKRVCSSFDHCNWDFWSSRSIVGGRFGWKLSRKGAQLVKSWNLCEKVRSIAPEILNAKPVSLRVRVNGYLDSDPLIQAAKSGAFERLLELRIRDSMWDQTTKLEELGQSAPKLLFFRGRGFCSPELVKFLNASPGLRAIDLANSQLDLPVARALGGMPFLETLRLSTVIGQPLVDGFLRALGSSTSLKHLCLECPAPARELGTPESRQTTEAFPALESVLLNEDADSDAWKDFASSRPKPLVLLRQRSSSPVLVAIFGSPSFGSHDLLKLSGFLRDVSRREGRRKRFSSLESVRLNRVTCPTLFELSCRALSRRSLAPQSELELQIGSELLALVRRHRWPAAEFSSQPETRIF